MDCILPGSSVHGILQARILDGVGSLSLLQGIFSTQESNPGLLHFRQILYYLSHQRNSRILEWVAYPFSRGIFSTQETNWTLLQCRQILYHLSHQGSPRILEWVAYPFSRGIFLTQESNWGLLHYRRILYQLSYEGSLIEYFYHGKYQISVIK